MGYRRNRTYGLTMIELLVVVSIVMLFASTIFPIGAKAKAQAAKAVLVSSTKQIGTAMTLYTLDYDLLYPRQDRCERFSAINEALRAPERNPDFNPNAGCHNPYYNRVNHYIWHKYLLPYTKTLDIFLHPIRERGAAQWNFNGHISRSFALNIGLVGAMDTFISFDIPPETSHPYAIRNSFTGGTPTGIADPSRTALFFDQIPFVDASIVPAMSYSRNQPDRSIVTIYPVAVREFWRYKIMNGDQQNCILGTAGTEVDPGKLPLLGITVGAVDGSARFLTAQRFLAETPTQREILNGADYGSYKCSTVNDRIAIGVGTEGPVNERLNYPLWGFSNP